MRFDTFITHAKRRPKVLRQAAIALGVLAFSVLMHVIWAEWKVQTSVFRGDIPHYLPRGIALLLLGLVSCGGGALIERAFFGPTRSLLSFRVRRPAVLPSFALTVFTPAMYGLGIPFFGIWVLGGYVLRWEGLRPEDLVMLGVFALLKTAVFFGLSCCVLTVFRGKRRRWAAFVCVGIWSAVWVACVQGSYGL